MREQEEQARRPGLLAGAAHIRAERAQDYRQHRTGPASSAREGTQFARFTSAKVQMLTRSTRKAPQAVHLRNVRRRLCRQAQPQGTHCSCRTSINSPNSDATHASESEGTQFTCFTGTNVRIMTLCDSTRTLQPMTVGMFRPAASCAILTLLPLLVQKYKC